MSMTRDEAIAWLFRNVESIPCLDDFSRDWHARTLAEAKAALAEPQQVQMRYAVCGKCGLTVLADANLIPLPNQIARCQHQAADASLDCTEPAVLCEAHGGHDACAGEIMRLQARIAEPVDVTTFVNEGRRLERDEIARALRASADEVGKRPVQTVVDITARLATATCLRDVAQAISDGSYAKWLPEEEE